MKHHWTRCSATILRWAAFSASALIAALALWSGGLSQTKWYNAFHKPTAPPVAKRSDQGLPPHHASMPPGLSKPSSAPLAGTTSSVSSSPQDLLLVSVMVGRSVKEGYAKLGIARENPQTYAAGALLANGARLSEIHSDYVVLERRGRSAKLYLLGNGQGAGVTRASVALVTVGGGGTPPAIVPRGSELLTDYLRPTPLYDGAVLQGYQVYPGDKPLAFVQMGLEAGDVITQIDGAPLSDPAHVIATLRQLLSGTTHSVTVSRGGSTLELMLDGSFIVLDHENERRRVTTSSELEISAGL